MSDIKQQNTTPQTQTSTQQQQQQQVEGQTIQVQQVQIPHNGNDQMHPQNSQQASSNTAMIPTSTMVMATPQQTMIPQQPMQNLQGSPSMATMPSQGGSTTITTMSTGPPQQMPDWTGSGRVQVIQQPLQNPTYIQPVYNAQGQLIVPGNIALHPGNMNQPIQVIAAGKAFQPGQMPHMLTTTQGKPIVQSQTASFPGYTTIPTSGSNQTLVISQLGVLGQTNILPQQQGKPQEMQKMMSKTNVANTTMKAAPNQQQNVSIGNLVSSQPQGITTQAQTIIQPQIINPIQYTCNTQQQRAVSQGTPQTMQFAPWQATFGPTGLPQGLAWAPGTIQSSALLAQGSQIFIRNPQQDQTGMFIQNAQPSSIPQSNQITTQQVNKQNQGLEMSGTVQNKTAIPKTFSAILPNSIGPQNIRPASSVSTQTGQTQTPLHQASFQSMKAGTKVRTKNTYRMPTMATAPKTDAANQTKVSAAVQALQPKLVVSNVHPGPALTPAPGMSPNKQGSPQTNNQSGQQSQAQQVQGVFQESVEQKPGQLMATNGVLNPVDRTIMPVNVSMPPGQMAPIMGNMIVQAVPGITTMTPGLSIAPNQAGVPIASEIVSTAVPLGSSLKNENSDHKDPTSQENGSTETGPGRPGENVLGSHETPENTQVEGKSNKTNSTDKLSNDGDKKTVDKDVGGQPKATMMVKPQVLTHVIEGFVIQESSEPFPVSRGCVDNWMRKIPGSEVVENGEPPKKKPLLDGNEAEDDTCKVNPLKWTVAEVCEFIRKLPGCADYVEDFAMQDIDGEALMLLKADHLMSAMSMKLGPAVKIIAKIDAMRANVASKEGV